MRNWGLLLGLVWLLLGCRAEAPPLPAQSPLQYVEYVTQQADPEAALPLLVVMHGLGDSPGAILSLFNELSPPTRIIAPRAPDPWGEGSSWYPVPQRTPQIIRARADLVARLIAYVRARRPTRGLAVVTGFSQGGVLSFALAAQHPREIAGAVPIAGTMPPGMPPPQPPGAPLPVRAFHGREDARILFADAERTVSSFREAGYDATLAGFDGVGHGVSGEMRRQIHAALSQMLQRQAP